MCVTVKILERLNADTLWLFCTPQWDEIEGAEPVCRLICVCNK